MKKILLFAIAAALPAAAQTPYKMAVIGLVHAHVWGHLSDMQKSKEVTLVGIAEPNPALREEAKKAGVPDSLLSSDYRKMIDETKPDLVWSFVENNRHLEIVEFLAPKKINIIFEKPLASTYKDSLKIQELANKYGVKVMCNYQMAWWPANYTAKRVADSGALGQIYRLHGVVGHGGPSNEGIRNSAFFAWLTDPVQNGAGALMDFGCYNALWSLWYLGRPESVYAHVNHLRPQVFPKVEDNADLMLNYKNGVGLFEGSWDLPRSYQDLEVYGIKGSVYMQNRSVEEQHGREKKAVEITPLAPEDSEPVAYMVSRMRENKPIEGMTALDINVDVVEIIDAAKESVRTGKAVSLPARGSH
ncbi:MAG TPA: Gfo/Idh/MocA family oxidoreductase [Bryobacteraceae bacterium]|nr:Gfo/Idh/MocA family oxidoreductase [Bryobacteraceae bacterium]